MCFTCPVCGFPDLDSPARTQESGGSFEICPSCGFQFGVTDDDEGVGYAEWRNRWIADGMPWRSRGLRTPSGWNPEAQLKRVFSG